MNRTFWSGFGVALVVLLLPILVLIDARSSSDPAPARPASPPGRIPAESLSSGETSASFDNGPVSLSPPLPPGQTAIPPPLPSRGPALESRFSPRPESSPKRARKDPENPEIVFSPERVRESLEKDPRRRSSYRSRRISRSGIREIVYDPLHVTTIRTAVSHVTLIDLPEEAREVYLGDSKLFLAEVFGPRVKIKPITWDSGTTTNMIVYTLHKQFAFRLKVVPEGEEDDLLTFYSPKSETVVNLNPIRARMEKDLARREKTDLRAGALATLAAAGPTVPVNVRTSREGVTGIFLGFSRLGGQAYALFELENEADRTITLTNIRLRMFRTSLFWEGQKNWREGQDFSQGYRLEIPSHKSRRVLLPADPLPLRTARDGYLAEIRVEDGPGRQRLFTLEARGGRG